MSEITKYDYLKKYINNNHSNSVLANWFVSFDKSHIKETEKKLGLEFPSQLKEFWQEIGSGFLHSSSSSEKTILENRIMGPESIADIMLLKEESDLILPFVIEELGHDDMPFFEISDLSNFLIMKPKSQNPNAVYDLAGRKIEDNFETFIYRLYHESPKYYLYVDDEK